MSAPVRRIIIPARGRGRERMTSVSACCARCGPVATALFGAPVLTGRTTLTADIAGTGRTPTEVLRGLSGKATLTMAEGGRLGLDAKALRGMAKAAETHGWGPLAKGQTSLDRMEVRARIQDGEIVTESVRAFSGASVLAASGRVDMLERNLDLQLSLQPNVPAGTAPKPAEQAVTDAISVRGSWNGPLVRGVDGSPPPVH